MSGQETILRVSATGNLNVRVGERVHKGQQLSEVPSTDSPSTAPVSGLIERIQLDPDNHEFVIVITAPA